MKLDAHKVFLIVTILALIPQILWQLMLRMPADDASAGGMIGVALGLAYLVIISAFILIGLPFAWITFAVFAPLTRQPEDGAKPVSRVRVAAAFAWALLGLALAGIVPFLFANMPAFSSLYTEFQNLGAIGIMLQAGFVFGIFASILVMGVRTILRRGPLRISAAGRAAGALSLVIGAFCGIGMLILGSQAAARPDFTLYIPPTTPPEGLRVIAHRHNAQGPKRAEIRMNTTGGLKRMTQMKTTISDAQNPATGACLPPPYKKDAFRYGEYECEFRFTTPKGVNVYSDRNGFDGYFVVGNTLIISDFLPEPDFVDNLMAGQLNDKRVTLQR